MSTDLPLPGRRTGKVRDIYQTDLADGTPALAIIATDRVSAFDVIMANGIPGKGVLLTQIAAFWFHHFAERFDHHLISTDPADLPGLDDAQREALRGRLMIGKRTQVIPIECVVRGYLAGSGWAEYKQSQTVCGIDLPDGLKQCDQLPEPIFTPATKAEQGHDENISIDRAAQLVGQRLIEHLRDQSIRLYSEAAAYAAERGIILADTKFEWGLPLEADPAAIRAGDAWAEPILIDEILTPDSSRFWPADQYEPGRDQPSFDKQFVRNYLQGFVDAGRWDKTPPGPPLPDDVVQGTLTRYRQAYQLLTDR
jgi:phosphoribosylaminoimidazole-succinocarboxamide synthase